MLHGACLGISKQFALAGEVFLSYGVCELLRGHEDVIRAAEFSLCIIIILIFFNNNPKIWKTHTFGAIIVAIFNIIYTEKIISYLWCGEFN